MTTPIDNHKLRFALVNVVNDARKYSMNKDLNGGFGTADDIGTSCFLMVIKFVRNRTIRLPILTLAYLQGILKQQGHIVQYFEGKMPYDAFDIILVYGSIVDYKNENAATGILKEKFPKSRVGIIGPFAGIAPQCFDKADFIIDGEPEAFFMLDFREPKQLDGIIAVSALTNLNSFPSPCFDGFPVKRYRYGPINGKRPFLTLQASRGCPFSCRFYCAYGAFQGPRVRLRSPAKVVDDILFMKEKYGVKGIQFRDPLFGINRDFISEFCEKMRARNVAVRWGMETRLDLFDKKIIKQMFDVGLRNINVGIETESPAVAKRMQRNGPFLNCQHQNR